MILPGGSGAVYPTDLDNRASMLSRPGRPLTMRLAFVAVLACVKRESPKLMSCGRVSLADRKPCRLQDGHCPDQLLMVHACDVVN